MASDFDSVFAATAVPRLMDFFGESVTYTPKGSSAQTVTAIIERRTLENAGPISDSAYQYQVSAWIPKNDVSSVTVGGDTIACKKRNGDAANTTYTVRAILNQTGDVWHLALT